MYVIIKRIIDVVFSILGLLVLFPIILIIGILIKLDSKGPVLFKQNRIGWHGKVFTLYKFRSMITNAESQGSRQYSFKDDPRVTKVGRWLRATSLDEIPQFINIIKGDMSFIGPRPPLTYHPWPIEEYTNEQRKRFIVRPGITGWAQIHGRKEISWEIRIQYDAWYVQHLSLSLDLKILIRTVVSIFTMKDNVNVRSTVERTQIGQ